MKGLYICYVTVVNLKKMEETKVKTIVFNVFVSQFLEKNLMITK